VTVRMTSNPISVDSVIKSVRSNRAGGIVTFIGSVREASRGAKLTRMELEAAEDLAKKDLTRIAKEAQSRFRTTKIAAVHRLGKLRPGDTIVVIAVSAPHRREAFSACKSVIDGMKKTTPIWKKEFTGEVGRWVEGKR